jgi:hypothetical protein
LLDAVLPIVFLTGAFRDRRDQRPLGRALRCCHGLIPGG